MRRTWMIMGGLLVGCTLDYGGGSAPDAGGIAPLPTTTDAGLEAGGDGAVASSCPPGYTACEGDPGGGCTHTATDSQNCGACGHACSNAGAVSACEDGACVIACQAGLGNCDARDENGCETHVLEDTQSCGACGHDCMGGTCANGECAPTALVTGEAGPGAIAVDATDAYWLSAGTSPAYLDSALSKVAKGGGAPVVVGRAVTTGATLPTGLALDTTAVYWADGVRAISRVGKDGTGLVTLFGGQSSPQRVAVTGALVYWLAGSAPGGAAAAGEIHRGLVDGGASTLLAGFRAAPRDLAADVAGAFWAEGRGDAGALVKVAGDPASDAGPAVIAALPPLGAAAIAIDEANVYVADAAGGVVHKVPKNGGPRQVLAWGQAAPSGIAVDEARVYWTNGTTSGSVLCVAKDGSDLRVLATRRAFPYGIAVDEKYVFWTERGSVTGAGGKFDAKDGAVMRVPK